MSNDDYTAWGVGIVGGAFVAFTAIVFLWGSGNVIGVSGILHGVLRPWTKEWIQWKAFFTAGILIAGASGYAALSGTDVARQARYTVYGPDISSQPLWVCIISGLGVGFGASMSNGCTSGHGLCGVSRLSPRSMAATMTFFSVGIITASLTRSSFGYPVFFGAPQPSFVLGQYYVLPLIGVAVLHVIVITIFNKDGIRFMCPPDFAAWHKSIQESWRIQLFSLWMGFLFGIALILTGMCNPLIILGFLNFGAGANINPQLPLVCVGCMIPNMIGFYYIARSRNPPFLLGLPHDQTNKEAVVIPTNSKPLCDTVAYGIKHPKNIKMEWRLFVGAAIFGFGWSLSGICPGPALINYATGRDYYGVLLPCILVGMQIHDVFEVMLKKVQTPSIAGETNHTVTVNTKSEQQNVNGVVAVEETVTKSNAAVVLG